MKRSVNRKRKAPLDLEAEAEEHQKRREVQYQSLLAPSTQTSPMAGMNSSTVIADHSFPQFSLPSLPDVQTTQASNSPIHAEPIVTSFADASRTLSELENMGYDQVVITIYLYCSNS